MVRKQTVMVRKQTVMVRKQKVMMGAKKEQHRMEVQNHFHQVLLNEDFHDLQDLPQKMVVVRE